MQTPVVMDTVESFAKYLRICKRLAYQYTRAEGFPKIQAVKRGKISIPRDEAIAWLKKQSYRPYDD